MSCGPCRLCAGAFTHNPEPPTRMRQMSTPTPDTGTLPGTALETYGSLLSGDVGRDAIHLAVYAVTTDERLFPGQHVGISSFGDDGIKVSASAEALIGIVDPFLDGSVYPGQWFWLTLYPRTITSLRHEWTHPAFDVKATAAPAPVDPKEAAKTWLENFVARSDCPDFHTVMGAASNILDGNNPAWDDEYMHFNDLDAHGEIPAEFWDHASVYLGKPKRESQTLPKHFSCSC